ncbi:MAG TPA: flagellar motor switch protein FliG [Nitrospirae bacterium]|nr:flagellar motor switch protein FliG [Nitrospirota bacterium]
MALSGAEKAAILLGYVGEEIASEIIKNLDKRTVEQITAVMKNVKTLKKEEVEAALMEIKKDMSDESLTIGGREFLKNLLTKGLSDEDAEKLIEEAERESPLDRLNFADPTLIVNYLSGEHPQTIAFVLSLLDPKKSAEVIALLPEHLKVDVAFRVAKLDRIPEEALRELEDVLSSQLNITESQGKKIEGIKAIADILNNSPKEVEQAILEMIEQQDPNMAESIRSLMFVFEDLINVDDRGIQTLLKEVSTTDLALALKTAPEELKQKIFRNMSQRAAEILKEEMETTGPVRVSDVEAAQQNIIKVARKLEEEGKIIIAGKGEEELIV